MTVSHLFYDFGMLEAAINYETYLQNKDSSPMKLDYNIEDPGF